MYVKECPFCGGDSYSAPVQLKWICPYCGGDLSLVAGKPAGAGGNQNCGTKRLVDLVSEFNNTGKSVESKILDNILYLKARKNRI